MDQDQINFFNNQELVGRFGSYENYLNFLNQGIQPMYPNNSKDIIKNKITQKDQKFGLKDLLQYLPMGEKSLSGALTRAILPKRDPVVDQTKEYFAGLYGLDDIGRISGKGFQDDLMSGYAPVSGGLLYNLSGGKFGDPVNLGLEDAYQKRIDTITNVGIPRLLRAGKDPNELIERRKILEQRMAKDNAAMQSIKLANASPLKIATMNAFKSGNMNKVSNMPSQPNATGSVTNVGGGGNPNNNNMGMRDTSAATAARDKMMGAQGKLSGPPRSARFK